jgi:Response regulators consisting of a CheY-like receiver domain and a winged-helix DNA-binding domain
MCGEYALATILIAEDDENVRLLVSHRLKSQYAILVAGDGREALDIMQSERVDLLIADIMMPRMDGFELVQNLRRRGFETPVLMLTANQSFDAKRSGFRSGTDDYMTKPVNFEELSWRIQALLRRAKVASGDRLERGGVALDPTSYTISTKDLSVELSKKEFELLFKLLSSPGRIYTKSQLMDDIWGRDSESGEETVKTHVSRLRNKIRDFEGIEIVAVKGIGYKAEVEGGRN